MDSNHAKHTTENDSTSEIAGECAIVINGVPTINSAHLAADTNNSCSEVDDPFFGEWLEGRKVRKLFGDTFYSGEVIKYDEKENWYKVVYEDGDEEDLEWHELEDVLVPIDLAIPLRTLAIEKFNFGRKASLSRFNMTKPHNDHMNNEAQRQKKEELVLALASTSIPNIQLPLLNPGERMQQPVDALNVSKMGTAQAGNCLPPKDRLLSTCVQKASAPANSMSIVPMAPRSQTTSMILDFTSPEASRRQGDTHCSGMATAKAEKQKRREAQSSRS